MYYFQAVSVPNVVIVRICGGLHFANKNNVLNKMEKLLKKKFQENSKSKASAQQF